MGIGPGENIDSLTIKPEKANIEPGQVRKFSLYMPCNLAEGPVEVELKLTNVVGFELLQRKIRLSTHPKYENLLYGIFEVKGDIRETRSLVVAKYREYEARAYITVKEREKKGKRKSVAGTRRGFFTDITPDYSGNPPQRAYYDRDTGEIKICMHWPVMREKLGSGFEKVNEPEAKILLAEIVTDTAIRFIVRRKMNKGEITIIPGAEVDSFLDEYNKLAKKYSPIIYQVIEREQLRESTS